MRCIRWVDHTFSINPRWFEDKLPTGHTDLRKLQKTQQRFAIINKLINGILNDGVWHGLLWFVRVYYGMINHNKLLGYPIYFRHIELHHCNLPIGVLQLARKSVMFHVSSGQTPVLVMKHLKLFKLHKRRW